MRLCPTFAGVPTLGWALPRGSVCSAPLADDARPYRPSAHPSGPILPDLSRNCCRVEGDSNPTVTRAFEYPWGPTWLRPAGRVPGGRLRRLSSLRNFRTPLHLAANGGRSDVIRVLVEAGASISAEDFHGLLPIHLYVQQDLEALSVHTTRLLLPDNLHNCCDVIKNHQLRICPKKSHNILLPCACCTRMSSTLSQTTEQFCCHQNHHSKLKLVPMLLLH